MLDEEGYWSERAILGYNCKYNGVLSDRGRGKSWRLKRFLLDQPGTSMCLYRTSTDMMHALSDFILPFVQGDKKHEPLSPERFDFNGSEKVGYTMSFDGIDKIWFRYLTGVNAVKQETFPDDMNWVWVDEFIPLVRKKLPGVDSEGDAIRAIVKTIEHDTVNTREERGLKPVRVFLVGNPFTWNNEILSYFHFDARLGYGIHKAGPGVVYENLIPAKEKNKGKMTVDEFLGDEVNRNQGWLDSMSFVMALPNGSQPVMSLRLEKNYFCMYKSPQGKVWITRKKRHTNNIYDRKIGTLEGLQEDEDCYNKNMRTNIRESVYNGKYRYDNVNTKFDFMRLIEDIRV